MKSIPLIGLLGILALSTSAANAETTLTIRNSNPKTASLLVTDSNLKDATSLQKQLNFSSPLQLANGKVTMACELQQNLPLCTVNVEEVPVGDGSQTSIEFSPPVLPFGILIDFNTADSIALFNRFLPKRDVTLGDIVAVDTLNGGAFDLFCRVISLYDSASKAMVVTPHCVMTLTP